MVSVRIVMTSIVVLLLSTYMFPAATAGHEPPPENRCMGPIDVTCSYCAPIGDALDHPDHRCHGTDADWAWQRCTLYVQAVQGVCVIGG